MRLYQLGLAEPKEDNRFLHVANAQWLVVMIKDKHFAAELAICANGGCFNAEDSITSFHYIYQLAQIFLEEYPYIHSKI